MPRRKMCEYGGQYSSMFSPHQSILPYQINQYHSLYRLLLLLGGRENLPNFSSSPSAFCFRTVTGRRGRRASRAATSLAPPSTVDEAPAAEFFLFPIQHFKRFSNTMGIYQCERALKSLVLNSTFTMKHKSGTSHSYN